MGGIALLDRASLNESEVLEVLGITSQELKVLVFKGKISKFVFGSKPRVEYMPSNIKRYLRSLKEQRLEDEKTRKI